jgi:hypothetical protein
VSSSQMGGWLDALQATMPGPLVFIYDACESGSFVSGMRPPAGKERVVITSASNEPAYFLAGGEESFSFQFWDRIYQDMGNLGTAYKEARNIMLGHQRALLEATWGNEIHSNETEDQDIADSLVVRRGAPVYITIHPFVSGVTVDNETLSGGTTVAIEARGVTSGTTVEARIVPPDVNPDDPGVPITSLPTIELTDPDHDGTYQGTWNGFTKKGTYVVVVRAIATHEVYSYVAKGMKTENLYSEPQYAFVTQTVGTLDVEPDAYEDDDVSARAVVIVINDPQPQTHSFHDAWDRDWVKFYGLSGNTYKIRVNNVSVACDPKIEVYSGNGTTRLAGPINQTFSGGNESLDWPCPQDGIYYVRVSSVNACFGETVKYDLQVYQPVAGLPGLMISGMVVNGCVQGVGGAVIKSDLGCTGISLESGFYVISGPPSGTHQLTATAEGYEAKVEGGVVVQSSGTASKDFALVSIEPLDCDRDGLTNEEEITRGTNPFNSDTDADGMPDGWEVKYNLDPLVNNASLDKDGDGFSNIQEYRAGTSPNNRDSYPRSMPWLPLLLGE